MSAPGRPGGPPGRWLRVLERMLPEGEGGRVARELERLYRARVDRDGRKAADRWLRRQVLAFLPGAARRAAGSVGGAAAGLVPDAERAVRSLARAPGFAGVVVLTLALGIGASALVFTVVRGVLLRPLPFDEPERLVAVWDGLSRGEITHVRERSRTLADLHGWFDGGAGVNLEVDGRAFRIATSFVEPGLFDLLGARPLFGRLFTAGESTPGATRVTILGEGLWRSLFGGDPDILQRSIILDGVPYRVVGVLPADWRFPDPADRLWLPLEWNAAAPGPFWGSGGIRAVGRLAGDASPATAQAELRGFSADISAENPVWTPAPDYRASATVTPLREARVGDARPILLVLLAAVGVVLLVVCANVSSLLVARSVERARALAVRAALGASRWRVVREALVESALLGVAGAALGAALALGGLALLRPALVGRLPRAEELTLDAGVLAFAAGVGLLAGLLAGAAPAVRAGRRDPAGAIRSGGRGGAPGRDRRRLSRLLVGAQVAAAVVLVTSASLLIRTLATLADVDPGFRTGGLVTAAVTFPSSDPEARIRDTYDGLVRRVVAVPGVEDAALAATPPFGPLREVNATFIEDVTTNPNDLPPLDVERVGPGYFRVMGIALLEGRLFTAADRADAPLVALVDETMARTFWPGASPIGRRIRYPWAGAPWIEVVGVVGSVADDDLTAPRRPRWYVPLAQRPSPDVTLIVDASLPVGSVAPSLREAVGEVDPRLPVSAVASYRELIGQASARTRITARVLLVFALVTVVLGCLGVHGVAAHLVRERRREIGVRMALGADSGSIRSAVVREGLLVAGPAAVVGLLAAAVATRALSGMLYGVHPLDPVTFVAVPAVTLAAAVAAMWLPAARAARVDPVESLRQG